MNQSVQTADEKRIEQARKWAMIVYALQAAGFIIGISYILAVVVAWLKLPDARGTWVESHYVWQIRTFWFSVLWGVLAAVSMMWMVGMIVLMADVLWMVYRIAVGWVRLNDNKPAYVEGRIPDLF